MTTAVELDSVGEADCLFDVAAIQRLSLLIKQVVQVVDVGAMVLAIVELEQVAGDDWLKGAHLIRKRLEVHATLTCRVRESSLNVFSKHYKF